MSFLILSFACVFISKSTNKFMLERELCDRRGDWESQSKL